MKVRCIDKSVSTLTFNKEYEVDSGNNFWWFIIDDEGELNGYAKKLFEEVNEMNIIEASNMPVGTEFKIVYKNGSIDSWECKVAEGSSNNILAWIHNDNSIGGTQDIINAKFIVIEKQKPVPFQEVIDKDCILCRVEHEHMNSWLSPNSLEKVKEYLEFNQLMELLSELPSDELKVVLKYGRWYIKPI